MVPSDNVQSQSVPWSRVICSDSIMYFMERAGHLAVYGFHRIL